MEICKFLISFRIRRKLKCNNNEFIILIFYNHLLMKYNLKKKFFFLMEKGTHKGKSARAHYRLNAALFLTWLLRSKSQSLSLWPSKSCRVQPVTQHLLL